jgi:hypothetical protein
MVLKRIEASAVRLSVSASRAPKEHTNVVDAYEPGRALVAVQPSDNSACSGRRNERPAAPFLAHLIATQQHEPQTRDHRRAEPEVAVHAYEVLPPGQARVNGRKIYRLM